ncbi:MAG: bis-aminopropyl spermidine synthase family protein [Caldisericaceae bacterium]
MERIEFQILTNLYKGPMSLWQAINAQDSDIKGTIEVLKSLRDRGLIKFREDQILISKKGEKFLAERKIQPFIDSKCPVCHGKGLITNSSFIDVLEKFTSIFAKRPSETTEFDQGVVPPENSIRRAEYVYERGDLQGKRILFLGDDDLTSVAMSLTGMPEEIVVIEVDERIVAFINEVADKEKLNLKAILYNAVNPLPQDLVGKFDTFLNDPVETVEGMRVFLSRCAMSLKGKGSAGYFGISHYESSLAKWFKVEKDLLAMNFVITDVLRDFNEYLLIGERILKEGYLVVKESPVRVNAPDYPWYRSTFMRLELIDSPNPLVRGEIAWDRSIYFDEDTFVVRP